MDSFKNVWNEVLEEEDDQEELVTEADTRKKASKGTLRSSTLTSCIAIGVYNGENGYMIHMDPEHEDPVEYLDELSQFTFHVKNEAGAEPLQVFAGGGHLPELEENDFGDTGNLKQKENMYGKIMMIEDFLETHFPRYESEWGAKTGHYSELSINVDKGIFNYDKEAEKVV